MPSLQSAHPCPELVPYVRAYAQRRCSLADPVLIEPVPAQLEEVMNFELGVLPGIDHRECKIAAKVWIGGAQTCFPGHMRLGPGVESFAIFFQPTGWSRLFGVPASEITNRIYDASAVIGPCVTALWNQLGEAASFDRRVSIVDKFLLSCRPSRLAQPKIMAAASYLFARHGIARISALGRRYSLSQRQFERLFRREVGVAPKTFAKVARFQAALDAKLADPMRTWLDIAHSFEYCDQMHMIHDFENLCGNSPAQFVALIGDVRPPALAVAT